VRQVTLVALYGEKTSELVELLRKHRATIAAKAGTAFQPYDLCQIHATIVGLARVEDMPGTLNRNYHELRKLSLSMEFAGLLCFLRHGGRFPFQVQIGGFEDRAYPFTSRGDTPYQRSFSIQKHSKGDRCVLMGWPIRGEPISAGAADPPDPTRESRLYPTTLDDIRRAAQSHNILHGYHRAPTDVDNDFYLRLGLLNPSSLSPAAREALQRELRDFLSLSPLVLDITLSNVYIASYEDEALPPGPTTNIWPLSDPQVTLDFIERLYK